ncbi:hypothetical protein PAXINDRAFT_95584 [Paxillus involutus ATCC 200175]|nr:hypothetical protein PAXINDRAFT_95584 [Paxillus involutus ATCC 200175]
MHFDHVGDLTPFQHAVLVMSADAKPLVADAACHPATTTIQAIPDVQHVQYITFHGSIDETTLGMPNSTLVSPLGDLIALLTSSPTVPCTSSTLLVTCQVISARLRELPKTPSFSSQVTAAITANVTTPPQPPTMSMRNLVVVLAHEAEREIDMPMFPLTLNDWAKDRKHQDPEACESS